MDAQTKKREDRYRFLQELYELSDGSPLDMFDPHDVATAAGLSLQEGQRACQYLVGEGLVVTHGLSDHAVNITHKGVREIENAQDHPERVTKYFPAVVNITHVQNMHNSQIQQGTESSSQSMTVSVEGGAIEVIKAVLETFDAHLAATVMPDETRQELMADLSALRSQVESPKPKASIMAECLKSARAIVEGMASTVLSPVVLPQIAAALTALRFS